MSNYTRERDWPTGDPDENPMGVTYNIAAGGCQQPYIGDFPPFTPYGPVPPVYPGQSLPNTGKIVTGTGTAAKKEEKTMGVWIIWAITPDAPEAPWVVAAWDDAMRDDDEEAFQQALEDAEEAWGGSNIRLTRTTVDYGKIVDSFEPVTI